MPKKKNISIKYTSRDFESIKNDLVDHAKRYYSDNYRDFTQASFGSMMLDMVAYVGDVLSYYLDYHVNESFLDTSLEFDNVRKHARSLGYKFSGTPSSFGVVSIYILCPSNTEGNGPDNRYLPILKSGTSFSTSNGGNFILTEDIDFSSDVVDIVAARINPSTGANTYFAVRAYGQVHSGVLESVQIDLNDSAFEKFKKVRVGDSNISEIISVYDSEGNRYYEVDNLAQEVIFVDTTNNNAFNDGVRSIIKPYSATRRFVLEQDDTGTYLQFGFGSDGEDSSAITDPSKVALKLHGKDYISSKSFDPAKLISTNKFGISPYNTILEVTYRANSANATNVPANSIGNVISKRFVFPDSTSLSDAEREVVENSLEVNNDEPITSVSVDLSAEELKQRAKSHFSSQNRAVTKQDYESLVYNMPSKFGAIKRASIVNDPSSTNRVLSLYVISEDSNGYLAKTNGIVKNNLKNWLNQYKAVNDKVEIMDPIVINFSVQFTIMVDKKFSHDSVLQTAIGSVRDLFSNKMYVGEPIYLTRIYEVLNKTEGVIDVRKVTVKNENSASYSTIKVDFDQIMSKDGTFIKTPKNVIMELKYPELDIQGTAK